MATKSERFEIRATPDDSDLITKAAEISGQSVSNFVTVAATTEAGRVLARAAHVIMPADQFDLLMQSLDEPDEAEVLARAARRPRRFTRE